MILTSNRNARQLVNARVEFEGNNTFGRNEGVTYRVYSYGYHFPIYAYKGGIWYANKEKYSVTTSKHQSQLKPCNIEKWVDTETLKNI